MLIIGLLIAYGWVLAYHNASLSVWSLSTILALFFLSSYFAFTLPTLIIVWLLVLIPIVILNIYPLRQFLISGRLLKRVQKIMPPLSATEKEAIEAGAVGWEAQLFSGNPKWHELLAQPKFQLSAVEQAFLEGPVKELCRLINDWDITHNRLDLPPQVWQFIKENRFWAMIIPKKYGGLEFSAAAQVAVLTTLASRSITAAITVSVPNSLGPAELLLHYGSVAQKEYYLPRLANGVEIPCFALTSPYAGSDAAAIPDKGVICRGQYQGQAVIGVRLNWDKRYITLSPVATVIGLAFRLYDPDKLMGNKEDIGISCALIPADTPGVITGRRHLPLNCAFMNGPTQGKDVFIPLDWLIGGKKMAGKGWRMLMECLSAGRGISLPTSALGGAQAATLTSSAYVRIRKQFNLPIGYFEGIQEPLIRIVAHTYLIDAVLKMTAANIDRGVKSAIGSAIVKYHTTELARKVVLDAMDIHGGKGICLGPRNYLGNGYQAAPISITVEGANILTRSFIIYGQGILRCHAFLHKELESLANGNLKQFDQLLFRHIGFVISRKLRALFLALTQARFVSTPVSPLKRYYQLFTRYSASLALVTEFSLIGLRGALKRCETLSGRLSDVWSLLYLGSAVLKQYENDDNPDADRPLVEWVCQDIIYSIEQKLFEAITNFPNRFLAWAMRLIIFPLGKRYKIPSDKLGKKVAELFLSPSLTRDRLTKFVYKDAGDNNVIANLEIALQKIIASEALERKIHQAVKQGKLTGLTLTEQIHSARQLDVITEKEASLLLEAEKLRLEVIAVDDFNFEALSRMPRE